MKIEKLVFPKITEHFLNEIFSKEEKDNHFSFGTVTLEKGTRIPEVGFTRHPEYEISYVESGKIQMINEDDSMGKIISTGEVMYFDKEEPQAGIVLETVKIIYVLIKI